MDENENEQEQKVQKQSNAVVEKAKDQVAKKATEAATKKVTQAAAKGVVQNVMAQAAAGLSALIPVLWVVLVVVLVIIIVVGIIAFLVTMPGLMSGKLNSFGKKIETAFKDLYMNKAEAETSDEDIIEMANYIESMDYDLIGFGFIKPGENTEINTVQSLEEKGYTFQEMTDPNGYVTVRAIGPDGVFPGTFLYKDGCYYDGKLGQRLNDLDENSSGYTKNGIEYDSTGKIVDLSNVDTSLLKNYVISNKTIYTLRNSDETWLSKLVQGFIRLFDKTDYSSWSKGLVELYKAEDYIAKGLYSELSPSNWLDTIEFKENGILYIKNDELFKSHNAMQFDMKGVLGRYGLSEDFLISLHLATLSPDLVNTMVQTFDTVAQVYLDEVKGATALAKIVDTASDKIGLVTYDETTGEYKKVDNMEDASGLKMQDISAGGKFEGLLGEAVTDGNILTTISDSFKINKSYCTRWYYYLDMNSPTNCIYAYDGPLTDVDEGSITILDNSVEYVDEYDAEDPRNRTDYYGWLRVANGQMESELKGPSQIAPYRLRDAMTRAVNSLKNMDMGFDIDDFNSLVALKPEENSKTNVKKILKDAGINYNPENDYVYNTYRTATDSDGNLIDSSSGEECFTVDLDSGEVSASGSDQAFLYSSKQSGFESFIKLTDSSGKPDTEAYHLFDSLAGSNKAARFGIGSECAYERGKPTGLSLEDCAMDDDCHLYSFNEQGGFCDCKFCSTFYGKYAGLVEFVYRVEAYNEKESRKEYVEEGNLDYLLNGADIQYSFYNNVFSAISHVYEWPSGKYDDHGNELKYRLSFYYNEQTDGYHISIVVSTSWEEDTFNKYKKEESEVDTCSRKIKTAISNLNNPTQQQIEDTLNNVSTGLCHNCESYVKDLITSLKDMNEENDFSTYIPYIARVANSWFRDTYFIIPTLEAEDPAIDHLYDEFADKDSVSKDEFRAIYAGENVPLITNDDIFLTETGELWTNYIEIDSDYALFLINKQGDFFESTQELEDFLNEKNISDDDYQKISKYIKKEETDLKDQFDNPIGTVYGRWTGSDKTGKDKNKIDAEEVLDKYNIRYVKKTITKSSANLLLPEEQENIVWNAYGASQSGMKWQQIDPTTPSMQRVADYYDVNGNKNGVTTELAFWVGLDGVFNIDQKRDGQRGITNSKIKYLFKNKKYYKYDGSTETAYRIHNDWMNCLKLQLSDSIDNKYLRIKNAQYLNLDEIPDKDFTKIETYLNSIIDNEYYQNYDEMEGSITFARSFDGDDIADIASRNLMSSSTGTDENGNTLKIDPEKTVFTNDPRNPNLIDNIDLQTESLEAFSILENTHTPDADYAYRDLKELIVELDYFDKEDLAARKRDVFEWLLGDTPSAGWPYRTYDKNNDYGSLIHSSKQYDELEAIMRGAYADKVAELADTEEEVAAITAQQIINEPEYVKDEDDDDDSDSNDPTAQAALKLDDNLYALNTKKSSSRAKSGSSSVYSEEIVNPSYDTGYVAEITINGAVYKAYKQGSGAYYSDYGAGTISNMQNQACGPTSLATILSAFGDENDPWDIVSSPEMANYDYTFGYLASVGEKHGVSFEQPVIVDDNNIQEAAEIMRQGFSEGKPCLLLVGAGNGGRYTGGGHYMTGLGENENGGLIFTNCGNKAFPGVVEDDKADPIETFLKTYMAGSSGNKAGRGFMFTTEAPGTAAAKKGVQRFEGYEPGTPIVSPATAKILEIGTVTVENETTEDVLSTFFVKENEVQDDSAPIGTTDITVGEDEEKTENQTQDSKKIVVTEEEYEKIKNMAEEATQNEESPFGKSYTTGYVKLEVIGEEALQKFHSLMDKENITAEVSKGYDEFYNDYKDLNEEKSLNSYIIYIEGIDLTGEMEESGNTDFDLDSTILGKLFAENSDGGSLSSESGVYMSNENDESEDAEPTDDTNTDPVQSDDDDDDDNDDNDDDDDDADDESEEKVYKINYYKRKETPKYYTQSAKLMISNQENSKQRIPSILKIDSDIYLKAGTTIGVTGNANMKIIMKDRDNSVIENVEDYLKIDDLNGEDEGGSSSDLSGDILSFFFVPYEGGPLDSDQTDADGIQIKGVYNANAWYGSSGPEVGLGIIQWTTLPNRGMNNVSDLLCKGLYELDSSFCAGIQQFISWTPSQVFSDLQKGNVSNGGRQLNSQIKSAFIAMDEADHEKLVNLEVQYASNDHNEYMERQGVSWILDRNPGLIGTYYSLLAWAPNAGWEDAVSESKSDVENIMALMKKAENRGSTAGSLAQRWNSQARLAVEMADGTLTEEQVMQWINKKRIDDLPAGHPGFEQGANPGYISSH